MRFLARLERKLVLFFVGIVEHQAETLANKHSKRLHVGMEKLAMNASFVDILASHKFVGWVMSGVPKVEMVPATRKMVTAVILAVR